MPLRVTTMRGVALWILVVVGCTQQHRTNIDRGRIEDRERALGMFRWEPPPPPPQREDPRWGKIQMIAYESPPPKPEPLVPQAPPEPTFAPEDIQRRTALVADWARRPGPGIAAIQTFGPGARGIVAYGDACSNEWLSTNVEPIWGPLRQHGFIAVHCQAAVERFTWPRSASPAP